MNTNEFEYYLLFPEAVQNSPAIILTGDTFGRDEAMVEESINNVDLVEFSYWESYPKKPVMVDFHDNGILGAVSKKVYDVLEQMNISKLQLIPAEIKDPKNKTVYKDYHFLHIYNRVECMDKDESIFEFDDFANQVEEIEKLVLDKNKLSEIPLNERLVFRLKEEYTFQLFHKSVADAIMAINPEGIRFVKVEDYNVGSAFD